MSCFAGDLSKGLLRQANIDVSLASAMNAFAELEQVLDPSESIFTVEGARRLVNMPPNAEKMIRMEELADKANEGLLSSHERSEYESLIHTSKLMSILRTKAGLFLEHFKAA